MVYYTFTERFMAQVAAWRVAVPLITVARSKLPSIARTFALLVSARSPPFAKTSVAVPSTKISSSTTLELLRLAGKGASKCPPWLSSRMTPRLTVTIALHGAPGLEQAPRISI